MDEIRRGQSAHLPAGDGHWCDASRLAIPPGAAIYVKIILSSQVSGVVHHGGAGTTSAGLRAGNPTFVCPFFGDQHFWVFTVRFYNFADFVRPRWYTELERGLVVAALRN